MPGSFRDELFNGLREGWCTALQIGGNFLDALPDPLVDSGSVPIARANRALYRLFCNREPPPPPEPPFTGGQCNFQYLVEYDISTNRIDIGPPTPCSQTTSTGSGFYWGPIYGVTLGTPGTTGGFGSCAGQNAFASILIDCHGSASGGRSPTRTTVVIGPDSNPVNVSVEAIRVFPRFGEADTCGDPPPIIPPPEPGYNDQDIPIIYSPDTGPDITVPVNFIFAPVRVNFNGTVNIPVKIDIGGINAPITGNLNINNPQLNLNFGNPNYSPTDQPKPDGYKAPDNTPDVPPDVPVDVPNPSPADDDDDTTRILRACIVTVNSVPPDITEIFQGTNPNIFAPNLGYVQFAINVSGRIAWTSDIPVKNKRNFIEVSWEGGAVDVRGTPRPGVTWSITPVYANVEDVIEFA